MISIPAFVIDGVMVVLRFLSALFLLVALLALVADATPALSGAGAFELTSLIDHWDHLSPGSLNAAETSIGEAAPPWLWSSVIAPLLSVPTCVSFGALALALGYLGRRRKTVNIFVN